MMATATWRRNPLTMRVYEKLRKRLQRGTAREFAPYASEEAYEAYLSGVRDALREVDSQRH